MDIINDGEARTVPEPEAPALVVDVVLAKEKYEELLESHHLMVFLNDPKAKIELARSPGFGYWTVEYTDPFSGHEGIEFGDTPREALEKSLAVIKRRRAHNDLVAA